MRASGLAGSALPTLLELSHLCTSMRSVLVLVLSLYGVYGVDAACSCSETCSYSQDFDCDDGGSGSEYEICAVGSDCIDCGVRGTCPDNHVPPSATTPPLFSSPPPSPLLPPSDVYTQAASTCETGGMASTTFDVLPQAGYRVGFASLRIEMRGDLDGTSELADIFVNEAETSITCTTAALCSIDYDTCADGLDVTADVLGGRCVATPLPPLTCIFTRVPSCS